MPFCPNCKYEYLPGVKVCPDCEVELVEQLEEVKTYQSEDFTMVYTCSEIYEAQIIKANLEGAGIPTFILSEKDSNFPALGDLAVIKLFVKNEDTKFALDYIKNYLQNGNFSNDEKSSEGE